MVRDNKRSPTSNLVLRGTGVGGSMRVSGTRGSLTGDETYRSHRKELRELPCACVHERHVLGQRCTNGRVWEAVFSVGSWKHSSCCGERQKERERERQKERERVRASEGLR